MRERKRAGVGINSMIAEIHGPFVKPQAITPIGSEGRTAKIERAKAGERGKEQEMPSGPNVWS